MSTNPELADKIAAWFLRAGFPLEYEVARVLRGLAYRTWQGRSYFDEEQLPGTQRDIDVIADLDREERCFRLVVECKATTQPWVVLTTTGEVGPDDIRRWTVQSEAMRKLTSRHAGELFRVPNRYGYSIIAPFFRGEKRERDQDKMTDPAYAALMQAAKAAVGSLQQWSRQAAPPVLALPVVVTSGPLFQIGLQDDGTILQEEVLEQRVVWYGTSVPEPPLVVDVVSSGRKSVV